MIVADRIAVFPRGISWGAVVAGALVALAAGLVLSMLGLGFGLGAVDVVSDPAATAGTITAAVGVWWSVSALVAFFLGGWIAGRIAGGGFASDGLYLGVLVWALATVLSFWLVTTAISTVLGGPIAVATDSVYAVLSESEAAPDLVSEDADVPPEVLEDLLEQEREAARALAARAEGAMAAGIWAALTLLLGGGAAVAGAWFATEPPAWSRPRRELSL